MKKFRCGSLPRCGAFEVRFESRNRATFALIVCKSQKFWIFVGFLVVCFDDTVIDWVSWVESVTASDCFEKAESLIKRARESKHQRFCDPFVKCSVYIEKANRDVASPPNWVVQKLAVHWLTLGSCRDSRAVATVSFEIWVLTFSFKWTKIWIISNRSG